MPDVSQSAVFRKLLNSEAGSLYEAEPSVGLVPMDIDIGAGMSDPELQSDEAPGRAHVWNSETAPSILPYYIKLSDMIAQLG